jgi:hypothetical protein
VEWIEAALDHGMSRLDRYVARPTSLQLQRALDVLKLYENLPTNRWTDDLISGLRQWSLGPEK